MNISKSILNQNSDKLSVEFLQLAKRTEDNQTISTGQHIVTLLSDEEGERINPRTHQNEKVIWFYVEENGVKKKYAVPIFDKNGNVHYLIQRLASIPEGTPVILEYKKKDNSYQGYIDVQPFGVVEKEPEPTFTQEPEQQPDADDKNFPPDFFE